MFLISVGIYLYLSLPLVKDMESNSVPVGCTKNKLVP